MATNSEEDTSSECSFGWVDLKDKKTGVKNVSTVSVGVMSSDSEEDSDATEFEEGGDSDKAVNRLQEQQLELDRNVSSGNTDPPRPTEDVSGELDVSRNENSLGSLADKSQYEDENSDEEQESSEEEEEEEEKNLKPFTKKLVVKVERLSQALSGDGNVVSPPARSMRVKSESSRPEQKHSKIKKSGTLIEGALIDSSQTLPFDVGANEDVWIVQCPLEISALTLKGKTLDFKGLSQIDQFESNLLITPQIESVNLLLPKIPGKVLNVVPTGHIVLKEKETVPQAIHPLPREENITSLPAGLKLRHPLFGTDLPLLKAPFGVSQGKKKKKKKNKHMDTSEGNEYSTPENGMASAENIALGNQLSPSSIRMKAKNKRKLGVCSNEFEEGMLIRDSEGINSVSVKKIKKHETEIPDGFDMSGSLDETSLVLDDDKNKKKKKKKHKYQEEFEREYVKPEMDQVTNENDEYSTSLLTQRLHESADDLLTLTSSDVLKHNKKKKKKIQHNYNELSNFSSETADDSFVPSHKKRKKDRLKLDDSGTHLEQAASTTVFMKTSQTENIKADSLHHLDHEMEGVSIKKRKKLSLSQTTEDNSTHTLNRTNLDEDAECFDDTPIKKKKKNKKSQ